MIYIDVRPEESLLRKIKDKHTLDEMKSKRKNYLSLIKEFNEIKIIKYSNSLDNKIIKIKNYIFDKYAIKNNQIKKYSKVKRVIWKKNPNRVLAGSNLNKSQKDSFIG